MQTQPNHRSSARSHHLQPSPSSSRLPAAISNKHPGKWLTSILTVDAIAETETSMEAHMVAHSGKEDSVRLHQNSAICNGASEEAAIVSCIHLMQCMQSQTWLPLPLCSAFASDITVQSPLTSPHLIHTSLLCSTSSSHSAPASVPHLRHQHCPLHACAFQRRSRRACMLVRAAAGSDDDASTSASGDTAAAELKETAALDELIDVLLAGRTQQEVWQEGWVWEQ
eukprot:1161486-Pelagomonas_calceolata.AAC.9